MYSPLGDYSRVYYAISLIDGRDYPQSSGINFAAMDLLVHVLLSHVQEFIQVIPSGHMECLSHRACASLVLLEWLGQRACVSLVLLNSAKLVSKLYLFTLPQTVYQNIWGCASLPV